MVDGDVIVVGAGLAGLVATAELADAGTFLGGCLFSGRQAGRAAARDTAS